MTQDEMERKLSASTGEAHFHYTRATYFETLVGRCHEALGEDAGSDHDSLPDAIRTHVRERNERIAELERALTQRPERQRILMEAANKILEVRETTVMSKFGSQGECRSARSALWEAAESIKAMASSSTGDERSEG